MFRRFASKKNQDILESFLDGKINTSYSYFLGNDSLILQVVEYLRSMPYLPIQGIKVAYQHPGWVIEVKMSRPLTPQKDGDFRAFMSELGIAWDGKLLCPWYISTTWEHRSPLSTLGTAVKLRWFFRTAQTRMMLKRLIASLRQVRIRGRNVGSIALEGCVRTDRSVD